MNKNQHKPVWPCGTPVEPGDVFSWKASLRHRIVVRVVGPDTVLGIPIPLPVAGPDFPVACETYDCSFVRRLPDHGPAKYPPRHPDGSPCMPGDVVRIRGEECDLVVAFTYTITTNDVTVVYAMCSPDPDVPAGWSRIPVDMLERRGPPPGPE